MDVEQLQKLLNNSSKYKMVKALFGVYAGKRYQYC